MFVVFPFRIIQVIYVRNADIIMRLSVISSAVALATLAVAETPEGFTPSVSAHLDVYFGSQAVTPPGKSLSKAGS